MNQSEVKKSTLFELDTEENLHSGSYNVSPVENKFKISPNTEEDTSGSMNDTTNADTEPEFVDITDLEAKRKIALKCKPCSELENFSNTTKTVKPVSPAKPASPAKPENRLATKLPQQCVPKRNRNGKSLCNICGASVWNHSDGLKTHLNKHLGKTFELM